jgi:UDP-N-acetylglucosamine/UDP-N-acetyl-alpha-D-glucosaminouronate 4-epimerase
MSERYLVTGGAGFIGSHIVRRLVSEGAQVRVVDNLSTGIEARLDDVRKSIDFVQGDLADEQVTGEVVNGIDFVLHQAAVPSVQRSVSDPIGTNRANVTATLNLLQSCRKAGARRVVYAASSSAYGDTEVLPKTEQMAPHPLSPYALQKLVGEQYCRLYYDLYGLQTVSLRYFNVFGPEQDPHSEYSAVIPKFISAILARKTVTVYGDGEQSRDFTYVENVVEANLRALRANHAAGNVCNIGCGERITLNLLIHLLEQITGIKAEVKYVSSKPGDVRHSLADIAAARRLLGYEPKVMLKEGLRRTVEAFAVSSQHSG